MVTDVHFSSGDYPNKPTSQAPTPLRRGHQHNNNQMILTTPTKDQAIAIPPGFSDTSNQDDFNKMTLGEQMQQCDDEQYVVKDKAEDAARPKNKWMILAAAMDTSLTLPIQIQSSKHLL